MKALRYAPLVSLISAVVLAQPTLQNQAVPPPV